MSTSSFRGASGLVALLLPGLLTFFSRSSNATAADAPSVATHQIKIEEITFTLPLGLSVQKIADQSLVHWPMLADWDAEGRLVVIESGGVSRPIEQDNERLAHQIVRLSDSDNDGIFDTKVVAADQLPFSEGVLCLGNRLLVTAPPNILELTDKDGDGYCEERSVWFEGQTITGCANDLHGPYEGPDGWIYWCKGAFAEQNHTLVDGSQLKTTAAHLFRRHRDGGAIESVATGGMDNPVEIAFLPSGERFFTSTFLQHPADGKRDGIAHAVYGGVHGKDHKVIQDHPKTGPLMPITIHLGAAAPSGLTHLRSTTISREITTAKNEFLAAALFNHHKVTAHQLIPSGASYESIDFDVLVGDRVDFHPTDVIEAADGSLIVIDTGGWYDLCCPSSRLDQKAAPGGIYRIFPSNGPNKLANTSNQIHSQDHFSKLGTTDSVASNNSEQAILRMGNQALVRLVDTIQSPKAPLFDRSCAIWMLCRLETPEAIHALIEILGNHNLPESLRCAAGHAISLHRPTQAWPTIKSILEANDTPPHLRRIAAEVAGKLADPTATQALIAALPYAKDDRVLEHSLLFAMMEIGDWKTLKASLDTNSPEILRALFVVFHQIQKQALPIDSVLAAAQHSDPRLREVAVQVIREQGIAIDNNELTRTLHSLRILGIENPFAQETLAALCQAYPQSEATIDFIAKWISTSSAANEEERNNLIDILQQLPLTSLPTAWHAPLANYLSSGDAQSIDSLAVWLRPFAVKLDPPHPVIQSVSSRINDPQLSLHTRLILCSCTPPRATPTSPDFNKTVIDTIVQPDNQRAEALALAALPQLRLSENDIDRLLEFLDVIPPLNLNRTLVAICRDANDTQLDRLLERLGEVPSAKTLTSDEVQKLASGKSESFQNKATTLSRKLQTPSEDIQSRVKDVLASLQEGDALRGYQVFLSDKAACSTCHKIAYQGRNIGPDLTQIGRSRTTYDLLEAILFPSARLEQSFQPTKFLTTDGQVLNGIVRNELADSIELVLATGESTRVERSRIEESFPSNQSIMPTGLAEQLSPQELADLIAFLKSTQ